MQKTNPHFGSQGAMGHESLHANAPTNSKKRVSFVMPLVVTGRARRCSLQQTRDMRAMDQGLQRHDQVDATVVPNVRPNCGRCGNRTSHSQVSPSVTAPLTFCGFFISSSGTGCPDFEDWASRRSVTHRSTVREAGILAARSTPISEWCRGEQRCKMPGLTYRSPDLRF